MKQRAVSPQSVPNETARGAWHRLGLSRSAVAYPESHQFEEEGGGGGRGGDENRRRGNFPRGPWEGWGVVLLLLS